MVLRPFGVMLAAWSLVCGAWASGGLRGQHVYLMPLVWALLLVAIGWVSLWEAGQEIGRYARQGSGRDANPLGLPDLGNSLPVYVPYLLPHSPGGHLFRWCRVILSRIPGAAMVGVLAAAVLISALTLLLPARMWPLNLAVGVIAIGGAVWRRAGRISLAAQAVVLVGLSWLAGHLTYEGFAWSGAVPAVLFALVAWGILQTAAGRAEGAWLSHGAWVIAGGWLVLLRQPLAACVIGLLLFGPLSLHLLRGGRQTEWTTGRVWPWLLVAMLTAACAMR